LRWLEGGRGIRKRKIERRRVGNTLSMLGCSRPTHAQLNQEDVHLYLKWTLPLHGSLRRVRRFLLHLRWLMESDAAGEMERRKQADWK
jgi:hypothetical protein